METMALGTRVQCSWSSGSLLKVSTLAGGCLTQRCSTRSPAGITHKKHATKLCNQEGWYGRLGSGGVERYETEDPGPALNLHTQLPNSKPG